MYDFLERFKYDPN